jgi:peroxiredoxin Q/BCP
MEVGDRFPVEEFSIAALDGPLVVYFYPRAGTEGCTQEANEFNRSYDRLEQAGVGLVGVSVDSEEANRTFARECRLRFPLVSDPGGELTGRLGLMKTYGDYGDMAARVTLLLDEQGIVQKVWQVEDIPSHVQEVIERSTRPQ